MKVRIYDMFLKENRTPYLKAVKTTTVTDEESYNNPDRMAELIRNVFKADRLNEEHVWQLNFDSHMHLIGIFAVSHGTVNSSAVSQTAILTRALLNGATCIAVAHCHPSGDCEPSEEDITFSEMLKSGAEAVGLALIDHVIVAGACRKSFYSFHENGLI